MPDVPSVAQVDVEITERFGGRSYLPRRGGIHLGVVRLIYYFPR